MFTASSLWPFINPGLPSLPPRRGQRGSHVPDSVGRWGAGLFQEKPHSLQNNVRTSLEKKKRGSGVSWASRPETTAQESMSTVYISKVKSKGHPAVYRLSLNASLPAPWQAVSPGDGEVPSFQ